MNENIVQRIRSDYERVRYLKTAISQFIGKDKGTKNVAGTNF